ncbi:MAG: hypothetical protein O3C21_15595 [Verrucomicrobia bacterium]|nr:hypothetical protein [Verrucomicrobiota bacterium]
MADLRPSTAPVQSAAANELGLELPRRVDRGDPRPEFTVRDAKAAWSQDAKALREKVLARNEVATLQGLEP